MSLMEYATHTAYQFPIWTWHGLALRTTGNSADLKSSKFHKDHSSFQFYQITLRSQTYSVLMCGDRTTFSLIGGRMKHGCLNSPMCVTVNLLKPCLHCIRHLRNP